ncbi:hypothetical protein ACG2LH_01645 [Zhouia sp. PK063]|uniref:hypothetical protein n=1 Tax=Zhouia sp. PK063 TaxID=3373602 RepID=UPI0037993A97
MNFKRVIRLVFIGLILLLHGCFIAAIIFEKFNSPFIASLFILFSIGVLVTYAKAPLHHDHHLYEEMKVAIWVPLAALITYFLNVKLQLGAVLSAALVGTLASYVPNINKKSTLLSQLPTAIYCGAFVGMSSGNVAFSWLFVFAAGCFTGVFIIVSKSLFAGVGGKLGTLAFAGVTLTSLLLFLFF